MKHRSRLRALAATAAVASAFAVLTPATVASAIPCDEVEGCRRGGVNVWHSDWILYVDADGRGSYWTYGTYRQDSRGHCFDTHGVGVGCPD